MSAALSARAITAQIKAGSLTARAVTAACLDRIAARDGVVKAFVALDPAYALAQAEALDAARREGAPIGPLHGVPIGVKDIIDTKDLPTANGSPLDAGRQPAADATLVARLRAAGAVIIGKTATTEFAFYNPAATANPHNPGHTPGGSSSGSAAAVGDGMVPLALGSQTGGSTIRPAAFCGTVGYKPTHGLVPLTGVLMLAATLDTIGIFARNVPDAALLAQVMMGADGQDDRTMVGAVPDLLAAVEAPLATTPTIALMKSPAWAEAEPETVALMERAAARLGNRAVSVELPEAYDDVLVQHHRVMTVGFAHNLGHYRVREEDAVSPVMRAAMAEGAATTAVDHLAALDKQTALRATLDAIFDRHDVILTPATPGEAPAGLASTGRAIFNAMWTFAGVPCVTVPVAKGPRGLPLGLQLVGRAGEDGRLLRIANDLHETLAATPL